MIIGASNEEDDDTKRKHVKVRNPEVKHGVRHQKSETQNNQQKQK